MEQREEEAYQPLTEDGQSSTGAGWRAWCGHRGKARACGRVLREKPQTLVLLVMLTLVLVVVGVVALFGGFDDKPCTPCRGTVSCCSARVVITRHGEKPKSGDGLSRDGSHRAQYLQHCCVANRSHALALGAPTVVVAPTVRDGKSHRARDTVAPMASELGLSVDLSVDKTDSGAFKELVRAKLTCGGTIFAAWVHADIPDLIEELDVPNHRSFRNWPTTCASDTWAEPEYVGENDPGDECYDQLWVVEFTKDADEKHWCPSPLVTMQQGFGGSASSACLQGLAPI